MSTPRSSPSTSAAVKARPGPARSGAPRSTSVRWPGRSRCTSWVSRATRLRTPTTTAASSRRSTRSRRRTSTCGRSGSVSRLRPGMFGENLTTAGIDVNEAVLGEHWRIGSALLSPCEVRIPCNTFQTWLGSEGFDNAAWVKRFAAENRPGPYLRVLENGTLQAGDAIEVEHRPTTASRSRRCSARSWASRSCCRGCSTCRPARGGVRRGQGLARPGVMPALTGPAPRK